MKRVLFVTYSHNAWGGVERWLSHVARSFSGAGWETQLVLARGSRFNDPRRYEGRKSFDRVLEADGRTGTDEGRVRAVRQALARACPDVVVPVGIGHALPAIGSLEHEGRPLRCVFPLHAMNPRLLADALRFESIIDCCVGVNPLQEEYLRSRGYTRRTATIQNGSPCGDGPRSRVAGGLLRLVCIARLEERTKRILDVVGFADELRRLGVAFELQVVGDGPDREGLLRGIAGAGLESAVRWRGYLDSREVLGSVLAGSDILVSFSAEESSLLVAAEAASRGVVTVTSRFTGLGRLHWFREGVTGVSFECGAVSEAARLVKALDDAPDRLAGMSAAAYAASQRWTWRDCGDAWVRLADDLVRGASAFAPGEPFLSSPAGRLDGLLRGRPWAADLLRRTFRRHPRFDDGWGEWPGTLSEWSEQRVEEARTALRDLESGAGARVPGGVAV